ncbi:telomere stability and silencing-domain-containing protein [Thamnocephalis sphaerospora]|uniref:Telomere stability and silencing-domain-containing protein n=1 Tax=Thamnocephalis sphaerospora TaxID=78915 RepID=A0A4P9XP72_9FUNG|nr:telomere stability and silencing-domain-containing protein [Thamnocephalis sphaerospora]|eukprot:RKP07662.1 telomere stability and silencing-domain-containing protein [Thamnocephalis sphaerospora]
MHRAIISHPAGSPLAVELDAAAAAVATIGDLQLRLATLTGIPIAEQRLTTAGGLTCEAERPLFACESAASTSNAVVYLALSMRLCGGKGGFGSELRKMGARLAAKKTTNFDSCRDLNGRRLKTVKRAKELADYMDGEKERTRAQKEKLKKKIAKGMKEAPPTTKHRFDDPAYFEDSSKIQDEVRRAVQEAIEQDSSAAPSTANDKGKAPESNDSCDSGRRANVSAAAFAMWDGEMADLSSSDESDSEETNSTKGSTASTN